jgi:hypothetical protein
MKAIFNFAALDSGDRPALPDSTEVGPGWMGGSGGGVGPKSARGKGRPE